ncbi:hypothetical protein ROJ8625_03797 [Roseivivax jejudonensis]|uniref:YjiS-like domain-containing protein n=1 Tax=Roseivivax jejudonensis TaxID=1529041 RepID=A0A1X7A6V4_9RHOB|nr:DUF1127 domain-containing protein [Roseivivax jejudonensis]SLN72128.1 hypothetical protein ROJ8625_03797 [Roseivivax jejudonensis]
MAQVINAAADGAFGTRFAALASGLRTHMARRQTFKRTLNELSALSDRELADLGLHRSQLRGIAWQAAHDARS